MTHAVKEQCHPLAIASIVIHTDFIPNYVCRSYHWGITTIPKNGMLGVTELSYYFWYDIHTSFFTVWYNSVHPHISCPHKGHGNEGKHISLDVIVSDICSPGT